MLLIGVFHINSGASSINFSWNLPLTDLFCNETVSSQKCSRLGLKSTFVSGSVQGQFKSSLNATMNWLVKLVKSHQCQVILEKLACASYTPQCEGHKMTTLCLSECDLLRDDCPEALSAPEVSSYCAEPADGNSESGFCELKTWPSARYWYKGTIYALVLLFLQGQPELKNTCNLLLRAPVPTPSWGQDQANIPRLEEKQARYCIIWIFSISTY